jgi:hypothetical protein
MRLVLERLVLQRPVLERRPILERLFLGVSLACAVAAPRLAHAVEPTASPGVETVVPLLWESPGCSYDKLGWVEIEAGDRVNEHSRELSPPLVDYGRAIKKLADAGRARGANAVVLRSHQGVYFTRGGKQSRKPVYVKLRGAAIQMADPAQCGLKFVDEAELEARSRTDKPAEVSSREAYLDD